LRVLSIGNPFYFCRHSTLHDQQIPTSGP